MNDIYLEKEKIREKYKGASTEKLRVIPAIEEADFHADDSEKRVAVYVRVSTNDPRQTSSFELQQSHYTDVIRRHRGWELSKIYADEGLSGTSVKRRIAFLQMIQDCEDGKIDLIVTKSVSRFSRNVYDCIGYVRQLAALKRPVGVFFETEHIYTLNKDSEMSLSFIATLSQEESHSKSNAMNLSYDMRFHQGILLTPELLGYNLDENGHLTVNENEALTVRLIFFMYLYGYTCQQIADMLMQRKRLSKRGSPKWSASSVLNVLQNERHCGDVLARKTWTPNYLDHKSRKNLHNRKQYWWSDQHEGIITRDDFLAVQRLIANAKHGYKGILPSLHVIHEGVLKGFISINPRWAGFRKDDYLRAANSIVQEDDALGIEPLGYAAQEGDFDLRGYEIARGQFFNSIQDIAVTFSAEDIVFSKFSLGKLDHSTLIELLIDPLRQLFAVRPSTKECRNAVAWQRYDGKKYHPKIIVGTAFLATLFQILDWDAHCKYRIRGMRRQRDGRAILLFDLRDTEITLLRQKGVTQAQLPRSSYTLPEDCKPLTISSQKNTVVYPTDWFGSFGLEYYRHAQAQNLMLLDIDEKWEITHPGIPVTDSEGLTPSTPEQLNQEIHSTLTAMQEEEVEHGTRQQRK